MNRVPHLAELQVDGRLLPGQEGEGIVRETRSVIGPGHDVRVGMECRGFSPVKPPEDRVFSRLFHGGDERILVDGYKFEVESLFESVRRLVLRAARRGRSVQQPDHGGDHRAGDCSAEDQESLLKSFGVLLHSVFLRG